VLKLPLLELMLEKNAIKISVNENKTVVFQGKEIVRQTMYAT
jgi:hypothetical protein